MKSNFFVDVPNTSILPFSDTNNKIGVGPSTEMQNHNDANSLNNSAYAPVDQTKKAAAHNTSTRIGEMVIVKQPSENGSISDITSPYKKAVKNDPHQTFKRNGMSMMNEIQDNYIVKQRSESGRNARQSQNASGPNGSINNANL